MVHLLRGRRSRCVRWLAAAFGLLLLTALPAAASGTYYSNSVGQTGYDLSNLAPRSPNAPGGCSSSYPPAPYAFGIVGVTGGRAFTQNACLASDYAWAATNTMTPAAAYTAPSLYLNLNAAIGSTASQGASGPYGTCKKGDRTCLAENYGWNAAEYAYNDAASAHATSVMWWIDIETANSWWPQTALNDDVIQAAVAYLQQPGQGVTVGIYSSPSQWQTIAGSYSPNLPNWVAEPSASCKAAQPLWNGGSVWLVQHATSTADVDLAC